MNHVVAMRNTLDIVRVCRAHGVSIWVQDGTLLGLVRDGGLIPGDTDTDTGALASSWGPAAATELLLRGFTLAKVLGTPENGLQHRYWRAGEKTDIFFHYREEGVQWHAAYQRRNGKWMQWRYAYEPFGTTTITVGKHEWITPDPPEAFLVTKYGPDWRTPIPKARWDYASSPHNSRCVG